MGNSLWYKDAVFYELHVRSFVDGNGDGMGDFKGLKQKLDYIQNLGVTAIWVLPFYPSPWRDDGYDISDYLGIHKAYGTLKDFKAFLKEAHDRGLKVVTELVLNHTSSEHPWFQKSRTARPGSPWRDMYVWSDSPEKYQEARIIFKDFEPSNWTWDAEANAYYWHRFYSHQPDLNFDNPRVKDMMFKVIDYWFEMGIDGLRLDAVPYLYEREGTNCENLEETHGFLKQLRAHIDEKFDDRMLLAEANQWPEDAVAYFGDGDECHMAFHFPIMPRLYMARRMEDRFPLLDILEQTPDIPETCQWGMFLRNHDELTLEMVTDEERDYMYRVYGQDPRQRINLGIRRRLSPLLENNKRKIEIMNILLLSLPGSPIIYYGDEIGMGDNYYLGDRDGVRTPMQWSSDKNAGFSKANPQRLYLPVIIDPEYHYEAINVETQEQNSSSMLWWTRRVIAARQRFRAFSRGTIRFVHSDNTKVLSFIRTFEDEVILVVVNLSRFVQVAQLELKDYAGYVPEEVFSQTEFPRIKDDDYPVTVGRNDYFWFQLKQPSDVVEFGVLDQTPSIAVPREHWLSFDASLQSKLVSGVLQTYFQKAQWYDNKNIKLRNMAIRDQIEIRGQSGPVRALLVDVDYAQAGTETYFLPVSYAAGEKAERVLRDNPQAVITRVAMGGDAGIFYDSGYDQEFQSAILELMSKRRKIKGRRGQLTGQGGKPVHLSGNLEDFWSRVSHTRHTKTNIHLANGLLFRLFRRLESGVDPDSEMLRALASVGFKESPEWWGALEYEASSGSVMPLGNLVQLATTEGDAWSYTEEEVSLYLERVAALPPESRKRPRSPASYFDVKDGDIPDILQEVAGEFYFELVRKLGEVTARMHKALARQVSDENMKPENFSKLYQRSLYQSMRNMVRKAIARAQRALPGLDPGTARFVDAVCKSESWILELLTGITEKRMAGKKIRIHGDYHLGQVYFSGGDFSMIVDFDRESGPSMSERRLKYTPFRDLASMIYSLHFALHSQYINYIAIRPQDSELLEEWLEPWETFVSGTLLAAYTREMAGSGLVPEEREQAETLLRATLLQKGIHALGYDIENRPELAGVAAFGVLRLLSHEVDV